MTHKPDLTDPDAVPKNDVARKQSQQETQGMNDYTDKPCLLLDKHRGIYFAANVTCVRETVAGVSVDADGLRHVYHYNAHKADGEHGVYSLASYGPTSGSKLGPPVKGTRYGIVGILEVSPEAAARFGDLKW
jgi:hypothetical protein